MTFSHFLYNGDFRVEPAAATSGFAATVPARRVDPELVVTPSLERLVDRNQALKAFALRFLDPEDMGYAAGPAVRDAAREALGIPRAETLR